MAHPDRFLLAGVMGWPVMHSRSPILHNYWFRQHGLAGTYVPLAIEPQGLAAALRALHPLGFAGCNLTIPHKQKAMAIVDEVDTVAKRIGAISCVVVRPDGSLAGSNNDCYGFIHNLKQERPGWRADAGPVVVLGAGGGPRRACPGPRPGGPETGRPACSPPPPPRGAAPRAGRPAPPPAGGASGRPRGRARRVGAR